MKVLVFDTWLAPFHVATSLEIAENHLAQGDEVQYVNISASLPFIEVHHPRKYSQHWVLRKKYKNIKSICNMAGIPCSFKTGLPFRFNFTLPSNINTASELKKWKYEDMDLGISILSSVISQSRDAEPNLKEYNRITADIALSCIKTLESFKYWCNTYKPERVYFVNGRTALTRPMLRYCQKMGIDFRTHERGGNENVSSYNIHHTFLHDLESYNQLIENHWVNAKQSEEEKIRIAQLFYERLRTGKKQWIAFNNMMEKGLLPEGFDRNKTNIVFFSSSVTEFAAIDESNRETLFDNQFEAVRFIANVLSSNSRFVFYVRLHPNTHKSFPKEHARWLQFVEELKGKLIFLDGNSGVDSYALMREADKIIVSYSTVGIEAPIYDKPVIAIQNARYHKLGSTYFPGSQDELKLLLLDPNLLPLPKIGSYKFAYFQMTSGIPFKYYKPDSRFFGEYRGVNIDEIPIKKIDKMMMQFLDRFKIKSL